MIATSNFLDPGIVGNQAGFDQATPKPKRRRGRPRQRKRWKSKCKKVSLFNLALLVALAADIRAMLQNFAIQSYQAIL